MTPILWFLVLTSCSNCQGDPGIMPGFRADYTKTYVAMPSQEVCEQVQKLNDSAECWARPPSSLTHR